MLKALPASRIRELDILRGIALLCMIFFHLIYDLNYYYHMPVSYDSGFIYYLGKGAATLFIFISGISCTLTRSNFKRGIILFFWALLVTASTSVAVPGSNIFFGILHLLAVSILLFPIFSKINPYLLLLLGTLVIVTGFFMTGITMPNNLLSPIGLLGETFYSADYYPLFPWFGPFLYGIALGKLKYRHQKGLVPFNPGQKNFLDLLGQHSLTIYLLHQPVLLAMLYTIFYFI